MTMSELLTFMERIQGAYQRFQINENVCTAWFEMLQPHSLEECIRVLKQYIQTEKFFPQISDIFGRLKTNVISSPTTKPATKSECWNQKRIQLANGIAQVPVLNGKVNETQLDLVCNCVQIGTENFGEEKIPRYMLKIDYALKWLGAEEVSKRIRAVIGSCRNVAALASEKGWLPPYTRLLVEMIAEAQIKERHSRHRFIHVPCDLPHSTEDMNNSVPGGC